VGELADAEVLMALPEGLPYWATIEEHRALDDKASWPSGATATSVPALGMGAVERILHHRLGTGTPEVVACG
jgi:hypothetical protein